MIALISRGLAALMFALVAACASYEEPAEVGIPAGETGGMCAGIAGVECLVDGDYCAIEPGVCRDTADAAGVCTAQPTVCTMDWRPVCGCDGETYPNACGAAGKGVSVAYEGECEPQGS